MRQPTDTFSKSVMLMWGCPEAVAQAGLDEAFNHDDLHRLNHDGKVRLAKNIGVIAGLTVPDGPVEFVRQFTIKILNMHQFT